MHLSPCTCTCKQVFFPWWRNRMQQSAPRYLKDFFFSTLPHTLGLLSSPFSFATSSLYFARLFSSSSSLEKTNKQTKPSIVVPPYSPAAWVTEAEKSARCQQEFSPAAGTWTFRSRAWHWVTALKQSRLIQSACSPWEGKHQKPVDKNLQALSVVRLQWQRLRFCCFVFFFFPGKSHPRVCVSWCNPQNNTIFECWLHWAL